ncbi:Uncharacterised protein [Bordetella pertussis]|nr:Uncharacterised protein [Bordetella pertussis]CFO64546.1 Uncharacterised protein [Bordetella pertussis]CFP66154.1 Uncharacterised protein [Bordetella pertussis]CFU79058.1 Uncharacterised protein [Bordetella pertussis]CFW36595.1 Uncharacterised protein [Bordetella pertussis]
MALAELLALAAENTSPGLISTRLLISLSSPIRLPASFTSRTL